MNTHALLTQLLTAGTALAGLILVFLGGLFTAFDSYDATAKSAVRKKYRTRARTAFASFVCALAAVVLALVGNWVYPLLCLYLGLAALSICLVLLFVVARTALREIG